MRAATPVLAAAAIVFGIVATHLSLERRDVREQHTGLMTRVAALEVSQTAGGPIATLSGPLPQTAAQQTDPAAPPATAAPEAAAKDPAKAMVAGIMESLNTPEGKEFARNMSIMVLRQQYPDLARDMNLTPQEAEQLLQLLAKQQSDLGTELALAQLEDKPDAAARQELGRKRAEQEQANERELSALLGSKYQKWKEYQRGSFARQQANRERQQVDQLRNELGSAGAPLSEAKSKSLFAAIDAEKERIAGESRGMSTQQEIQRMPEDHRRLMSVASAHLDAEQLERYRRHLEQEAAMAKALSGIIGTMGGGGASR